MSNQTEGRGAVSPVVAFVSLLALLAAVAGAVIWAGQTDQKPIPPAPVGTPDPTTDHTLTDAEAIARFKELDALRVAALEKRTAGILRQAFTATSPAAERLRTSIRTLKAQAAFADELGRLVDVRVLNNSPEEIRLLEDVIVDVRFYDAQGRDVTRTGRRERQKIKWTLRFENGRWLIHDAVIASARPVSS